MHDPAPSMNKKILYLPVEIVERELDAKLLLLYGALKRGHSVVLGNYKEVESLAKKGSGGVYFYKAMTDQRNDMTFEPLRKRNVAIAVLDEEGLIFPSLDYYVRTRVGHGHALKNLASIMTWGPKQAEHLARAFPDQRGKIVSVGNPRMDLLREPLRALFSNQAKEIRRKHGPFLLINTNFGPGNYSKVFKMSYVEHMRQFGRIQTAEEERFYQERVQYYATLFDEYVTMVRDLAKQFPQWKIIVRPHPGENHSAWKNRLRGVKGVRVKFQGSANNWILASEAMIHTGCTTGLEAFLLDKPVVRYNPYPRADMESGFVNELGTQASNIDDLAAALRRLNSNNDKTAKDEQSRMLAEWIGQLGDGSSSEAILDELDRLSDLAPFNGSLGRFHGSWLAGAKWALRRRLDSLRARLPRWLAGRGREWLQVKNQRFSGISRRDCLRGLRRLGTLNGGPPGPFRVYPCGRNTYFFEAQGTSR